MIAAAEEMRSRYAADYSIYGQVWIFGNIAAIVKAEASKTDIPVCLHLDHGNSFELAVQAMESRIYFCDDRWIP